MANSAERNQDNKKSLSKRIGFFVCGLNAANCRKIPSVLLFFCFLVGMYIFFKISQKKRLKLANLKKRGRGATWGVFFFCVLLFFSFKKEGKKIYKSGLPPIYISYISINMVSKGKISKSFLFYLLFIYVFKNYQKKLSNTNGYSRFFHLRFVYFSSKIGL